MASRPYLPVAINMRHRSAVVIGAGEPAYFKTLLLADFGISTTVVAHDVSAIDGRFSEFNNDESVHLVRREYEPGLLKGHYMAVIATGDRETDYAVEADARAQGLLVNVVDDPDHCDFFASAYVRHGVVSVAVSSGGASPGFTAALKDDIAARYGSEIEEHLGCYLEWRALVRSQIEEFGDREHLWRELRSSGLYDMLREQGPKAARELVERHLAEWTKTKG